MISIYSPQITPKSSYSQSKNKCSHKTSCLAPHTQPAATQVLATEKFWSPPGAGRAFQGREWHWNWSGAKWRSETVPSRFCVQSIFLPQRCSRLLRTNQRALDAAFLSALHPQIFSVFLSYNVLLSKACALRSLSCYALLCFHKLSLD